MTPPPSRGQRPALLLLLVLGPLLVGSDCDGCYVPNPLRKKPVVCTDYLGCAGLVSCPPGKVPGCMFQDFGHKGVCTCLLPVDGGGPPDFDPAHLPDPFHKNDAGKWVPDDEDGGT